MVYSQASVRKMSDFPARIFPWILERIPPTEMVGSQSAFIKISAIIEVVVVLPCVPATLIAVE